MWHCPVWAGSPDTKVTNVPSCCSFTTLLLGKRSRQTSPGRGQRFPAPEKQSDNLQLCSLQVLCEAASWLDARVRPPRQGKGTTAMSVGGTHNSILYQSAVCDPGVNAALTGKRLRVSPLQPDGLRKHSSTT